MDGLFGNAGQQAPNYAQTGATFGRAIGRLFGLRDPVLERRTILAETDFSDPSSIRAAAQKLMAQGDIDAGIQLASQARQIDEKERAFGLQERQTTATEKRLENEQLNQAARLDIDERTLELRKKELEQRADLTQAQIDKVYAEIEKLDRGDYYIVEQKGGDLGTTTVGFIAINKRNPSDQRSIPLVSSGTTPAAATPTAPAPAASGNRPPLSSFGAPR